MSVLTTYRLECDRHRQVAVRVNLWKQVRRLLLDAGNCIDAGDPAQRLLAWLRSLALDGELALAKPKRLRGRLLHVAGRIPRTGRRRTLHLPHGWPWATELLAAFARLRALAAPG